MYIAKNLDTLLIFTTKGKVFSIKVYEIPETGKQARGKLIGNIIKLSEDESVSTVIKVREFEKDRNLFFVTRNGVVKKSELTLFGNINKNGKRAIRLNDDDEVMYIGLTSGTGEDEIFAATRNGIAMRFSEKEVRSMGTAAAGVKGITQMCIRDRINSFKKALLDITAHVNVVLDYPEEGIDDPLPVELRDNLEAVYEEATRLIESYDKGKKIKEGIKTVIVGKPNVGKSTLLNSLLREERAIVTHVAGTTRDVIEEVINIKGIPLVLVDTAGIRQTDDIVENIGVEKSKEFIEKADLVLLVLDASRELEDEDSEVINQINENHKKVIVLLNKIDLERKIDLDEYNFENIVEISAQKNVGIEDMEEKIYSFIVDEKVEDSSEKLIITNVRHKTARCV